MNSSRIIDDNRLKKAENKVNIISKEEQIETKNEI